MKIAVGLIFFDDVNGLKRCIPTLKVDKIYAVDGRFKNFKGKEPLSTDGSREYLQTFKHIQLIDAPDLEEVDKRNVYLRACKEDFLLRIDSDEWLEGDWSEFRKEISNKVKEENGLGYYLLMHDLARKDTAYYEKERAGEWKHWQCVGYFQPHRIKYKHSHDWFEADGEKIEPFGYNKYNKLTSLKIFNEKSLRDKERKRLGEEWYAKSRKKEVIKIRMAHMINKIKKIINKI